MTIASSYSSDKPPRSHRSLDREINDAQPAAGPSAEELINALLVWARPDAPFVVAGAEVRVAGSSWRCRWHPIIAPSMGHPIDVLRWASVPASWLALGVTTWGTARPVDVSSVGTEQVRASFVLTRTGESIGKVCYPDGGQYLTAEPVGRIVDACVAALLPRSENENGRRH